MELKRHWSEEPYVLAKARDEDGVVYIERRAYPVLVGGEDRLCELHRYLRGRYRIPAARDHENRCAQKRRDAELDESHCALGHRIDPQHGAPPVDDWTSRRRGTHHVAYVSDEKRGTFLDGYIAGSLNPPGARGAV